MKWVYNDGGRFAAGYQYHVNDCVCRALSIVTERPYREVQRTLKTLDAMNPRGRGGYPQYLTSLGFEWFPCTDIVHFSADELPQGRIVVQIKEHLAAVINGVLHDTYDCSRNGTVPVTVPIKGYWALPSSVESATNGKSFILMAS
jgi:hypothetical protein